jgi:hypothetical protein
MFYVLNQPLSFLSDTLMQHILMIVQKNDKNHVTQTSDYLKAGMHIPEGQQQCK